MKVPGHLHIDQLKLAPGQEWTDASASWRFVRLANGAAYWFSKGEVRPMSEGQMLVVAPGVNGTVRASQIGDVALHAFQFDPNLLCGLLTLEERHFFDSCVTGDSQEIQLFPSTHPNAQLFASLANFHQAGEGLARRLHVLELVAGVFDDQIARHKPQVSPGTTALDRFKQIIARMPDTEMINHPPEDLARLCGCSPRHFNRLFHSHFGVSTRAWQTELRLLKARQLLKGTENKIVQVALDSGYRNLSLFNALFKRRFGMTPSEFRRKSERENGNLVQARQ